MKTIVCAAVLFAFTGSLIAAESAKDTVITAAKKLADQGNYTWKTTVSAPEGARFRAGPIEGKTEKDGLTHVTMTLGENKMQAVMKGDKAAVTNQDGEWQSTADLEDAQGPERFRGMMVRNISMPATQAVQLVGYTKDLKKEGDAFTGTLTEEGVKALASFRGGRGGGGRQAPEITNPSGTAKFWVKDGVLSKYEFQIKGTRTFNDNESPIDRTTTVDLKDIGTTKLQVPDQAKQKLS